MPPSITSDMSSSSPSSEASSIRLSSSSAVLGLDDVLVLLDRDLVLGLLELGLGLRPRSRPAATAPAGDDGSDRRARAAGAVEDLEVEHGTAGGAEDRGAAEVVEAGATALADPLRAPFRLGQTQSPSRQVQGRGAAIAMSASELSKANSAPGRASRALYLRAGCLVMLLRAAPHGALSGAARLPGDKSISHRSLMLAAMAVGESRIEGLLEGEDVLATAGALRAMGVELERTATAAGGSGAWASAGSPSPTSVLDMGNAGTGARLLMGLLAGPRLHQLPDRRRLAALAADAPGDRAPWPDGRGFLARSGGRLPLALTGAHRLLPIVYESPVASAQVKSAVLLAGPARAGRHDGDRAAGLARPQRADAGGDGRRAGGRAPRWRRPARVTIRGQPELRPQSFVVPGDPSSAGFPAVAAAVRRARRPARGRRPQPAAHRPLHDAARDGRRHHASRASARPAASPWATS